LFFILTDTIIIVLEAICCKMFFDIFLDAENIKKTKSIINLIVLSFVFIIISFTLTEYFIFKEILSIIAISVIMISFYSVNWKKAGALSFLFQGSLVAMEYVAYIIVQIIVSDLRNMNDSEELIGRFIVLIDLWLMFLFVIHIKKIFKSHKLKLLYNEEWIKFIIFPIFTILVISAIVSTFKSNINEYQMRVLYIISIGMIFMNYVLFYIIEDTVEKSEIIREKEIFEIQSKNQLELYSKIYDNYEHQRMKIHEFKNHIMCLSALADNEGIDDVRKYLHGLSDENKYGMNLIDVNNIIINSIVNIKYNEAVSYGIAFVFELDDMSDLVINNKDMAILLSNLLNNAIEAAKKCNNKKIIKFKMKLEENQLILSVKNTYFEPVIRMGDTFITSKNSNNEIHGYGIRNIINVVKKYKGNYIVKNDDLFFDFSMIIPNEKYE